MTGELAGRVAEHINHSRLHVAMLFQDPEDVIETVLEALGAERDEWCMKAAVNAEAADRLGRMLEETEAERDAANTAHELMARQFRTMQAEKEHGWHEANRQESRADAAEAERDALSARVRDVVASLRDLAEERLYDGDADRPLPGYERAYGLADALDASLGDEKPQPSEPESRTWHRQHIEQYDLAAAAKRIVAWVNANGGEAELRFLGPNDVPRIAVRTADGWQYAKPGDRIVKGEVTFRPVSGDTPFFELTRELREFTVSPVESSGSAE